MQLYCIETIFNEKKYYFLFLGIFIFIFLEIPGIFREIEVFSTIFFLNFFFQFILVIYQLSHVFHVSALVSALRIMYQPSG